MCGHHPAGACQAHGQHGLSLATAEPTCGRRNAHGSKEPAPMCGPGSQQPSLSLPAKNICWPEQPMPPLCCLEMFPDQKDWRNRSRNPTALERVPERQTERGGIQQLMVMQSTEGHLRSPPPSHWLRAMGTQPLSCQAGIAPCIPCRRGCWLHRNQTNCTCTIFRARPLLKRCLMIPG